MRRADSDRKTGKGRVTLLGDTLNVTEETSYTFLCSSLRRHREDPFGVLNLLNQTCMQSSLKKNHHPNQSHFFFHFLRGCYRCN